MKTPAEQSVDVFIESRIAVEFRKGRIDVKEKRLEFVSSLGVGEPAEADSLSSSAIVGDYDGDGKADMSIFLPSEAVTVSAKRYSFDPDTWIIKLVDELNDVDFTALRSYSQNSLSIRRVKFMMQERSFDEQ